MAVIKANEVARPGKHFSGYNLGDFVIEGQQVVAAARAKAEQMIVEARAQAEQIKRETRRQAHEQGYEQGLTDGREAGHREAFEKAQAEFQTKQEHLAAACESLFRDVDRRKRELLQSAHRDLIELAVAIAERTSKRIGLVDRQAARENLMAAIELVGETSDLVVEVNPTDAETLEAFAGELVARRSELKHVTVTSNAEIAPGGCLVRTRGGKINATLETQLERIAHELVPAGASSDQDDPLVQGNREGAG